MNNTEPAVLGNKLKDVIDEIGNYISSLQESLTANPYTSAVGLSNVTNFAKLETLLKTKYLSNNVELN